MWAYTRGKRNSAYEAISWIRANFELRESSCIEFLRDAGPWSENIRAVVRRYKKDESHNQSLHERHVLSFNAIAGLAYSKDTCIPFEGGLWSPSVMPGYSIGIPGGLSDDRWARVGGRYDGEAETLSAFVRSERPLPFEDNRFDMVTIASSVEKIADITPVLQEAYRILKPKGTLRLDYETITECVRTLGDQLWVFCGKDADSPVRLMLCEADDSGECLRHFGLLLDISRPQLESIVGTLRSKRGRSTTLAMDAFDALRSHVKDAVSWESVYPQYRTLLRMLRQIGFRSIRPDSLSEYVFERASRRQAFRQRMDLAKAGGIAVVETEDLMLTMDIPANYPRGECGHLIKGVK